jgi:hypothetical protein
MRLIRNWQSWVPLAACLVFAFVFRLVLGHYVLVFKGESATYLAVAHNLAAGHGYSKVSSPPYIATDQHWPGYPVILSVAFLFNTSHASLVVANAILGTIATLFVYLISRALNLSSGLTLAATATAAVFISTASIAGVAAVENLSVPAVLAFVYVVLIRPPKSRVTLFVLGSLLAWLAALTREELLAFVVIAAVVAGRRAKFRALTSVGLVICFLVGPALWVMRNEIQVHRLEYTDSINLDQAILPSVNTQWEGSSLYREGGILKKAREVTPSQRAQYQHAVFQQAKSYITHDFVGFVANKVSPALEYPFPDPIDGYVYGNSSLLILAKLGWSFFLLIEYLLALIAGWRCWVRGYRWNVVSIGLFPAFALCLVLVDAPEPRYWLPSVLLLLPAAFAGIRELPWVFRKLLAPPRASVR